MRKAAKIWLLLGAVHLIVWPAISVIVFNKVDFRYLAFVLYFAVPLVQATVLASANSSFSEFRAELGGAEWLLIIDAIFCVAVIGGLDPRAIALVVVVKSVILIVRRRFVLGAAAFIAASHMVFNLSNLLSEWVTPDRSAVRWMIVFSILNALLLGVLFRDRSTGPAPFFTMLGFSIVVCSFFLHPYLSEPWTAFAPTLYSMTFSAAIAGAARTRAALPASSQVECV